LQENVVVFAAETSGEDYRMRGYALDASDGSLAGAERTAVGIN
jgi:hypothetical protein